MLPDIEPRRLRVAGGDGLVDQAVLVHVQPGAGRVVDAVVAQFAPQRFVHCCGQHLGDGHHHRVAAHLGNALVELAVGLVPVTALGRVTKVAGVLHAVQQALDFRVTPAHGGGELGHQGFDCQPCGQG